MKTYRALPLLILVGMLGVSSLATAPEPVSAQESYDCTSVLMEAANNTGLQGEVAVQNGTHIGPPTPVQCCQVSFTIYQDPNLGDGRYDSSIEYSLTQTYLRMCEYDLQSEPPLPSFLLPDQAVDFYGFDGVVSDDGRASKSIEWWMDRGNQGFWLQVFTQKSLFRGQPAENPAPDPLPAAERLLAAADSRLPFSTRAADPPVQPPQPIAQPTLPTVESGVVTDSSDVPQDQTVPPANTTPADESSSTEVPAEIVLGSLGIPVAGAMAGSLLAAVLSALSSSGAAASHPAAATENFTPEPGANSTGGEPGQPAGPGADDRVWSPRPWDEAGPGYVTREEYERTQSFLKQGYQWTKDGWQKPDEIRQSAERQAQDRAASAAEDAQWRAEMEKNRQEAIDESDARLRELRFEDFKERLELLDDRLYNEKIYVLNPYQGDPTVVGHKLLTGVNMVYDMTAGQWTGKQGLTCQGYVERTYTDIQTILKETMPGSRISSVVFEEKSTTLQRDFMDWCDSWVEDNHNLIKVTAPDGSEWAVDFHQRRVGNSPLLRKWDQAVNEWQEYMGDEFGQRVSTTMMIE